MEAGLSLGSNEGERLPNLKEAKRRIAALPGARILAQSPVYETEPVGVKPEYKDLQFLNAVLVVDGPWNAHEWLDRMREIETGLGRERTLDRFAPRTIDIDLIYVGNQRLESGGLVLPHPHWAQRRFVVQPLADVRPDLVLPGADRPVRDVLRALPERPAVTWLTRDW